MNTTTITNLKPSAVLATAMLFVAALTASAVSPGNTTATEDARAPIIHGSGTVGHPESIDCENNLLCGIHSGSGGVLATEEEPLLGGSGSIGELATQDDPILGGTGSVGIAGDGPLFPITGR